MLSTSARQAMSKGSRIALSSGVKTTRLTSRLIPSSSAIVRHDRASHFPLASKSTPYSHFSTTQISRQEHEQEQQQEQEMSSGEKDIHDILTREFQPATLQVQDVSGGCGSFYAIVIASSQFNGKPTVKAHRLVNEALKDVISGIHGLQLRTMPVKS